MKYFLFDYFEKWYLKYSKDSCISYKTACQKGMLNPTVNDPRKFVFPARIELGSMQAWEKSLDHQQHYGKGHCMTRERPLQQGRKVFHNFFGWFRAELIDCGEFLDKLENIWMFRFLFSCPERGITLLEKLCIKIYQLLQLIFDHFLWKESGTLVCWNQQQ